MLKDRIAAVGDRKQVIIALNAVGQGDGGFGNIDRIRGQVEAARFAAYQQRAVRIERRQVGNIEIVTPTAAQHRSTAAVAYRPLHGKGLAGTAGVRDYHLGYFQVGIQNCGAAGGAAPVVGVGGVFVHHVLPIGFHKDPVRPAETGRDLHHALAAVAVPRRQRLVVAEAAQHCGRIRVKLGGVREVNPVRPGALECRAAAGILHRPGEADHLTGGCRRWRGDVADRQVGMEDIDRRGTGGLVVALLAAALEDIVVEIGDHMEIVLAAAIARQRHRIGYGVAGEAGQGAGVAEGAHGDRRIGVEYIALRDVDPVDPVGFVGIAETVVGHGEGDRHVLRHAAGGRIAADVGHFQIRRGAQQRDRQPGDVIEIGCMLIHRPPLRAFSPGCRRVIISMDKEIHRIAAFDIMGQSERDRSCVAFLGIQRSAASRPSCFRIGIDDCVGRRDRKKKVEHTVAGEEGGVEPLPRHGNAVPQVGDGPLQGDAAAGIGLGGLQSHRAHLQVRQIRQADGDRGGRAPAVVGLVDFRQLPPGVGLHKDVVRALPALGHDEASLGLVAFTRQQEGEIREFP